MYVYCLPSDDLMYDIEANKDGTVQMSIYPAFTEPM